MNAETIQAADLLCRPAAELFRMATRLRKNPDLFVAGCAPFKVVVLSSFTNDYLVDMLRLMLAHRGVAANIVACGYGQMIQELLTWEGCALGSGPELLFVLPTHLDLRHAPAVGGTAAEAAQAVVDESGFWRDLISRAKIPTVMLSFAPPPYRALSEADGLLPGGLGRHVREVNIVLADTLDPSVSLVDAEALHFRLGLNAFDDRLYGLCKQPYAMDGLPEVADTLAAAAAARLGRARKVLVLDLDHTIWGGVVGDVGIEGLSLGTETPEGEAFVAFQRYVQGLARRGVILAVCSKNVEEVARLTFCNHSAMVLSINDIACFVANFDDKATNLRRIAETLNVGLEALVFVDDNPAERAWVRQQLPQVWTVELPEEPALYARAVEATKPFPVHRLTQEDIGRTSSYRALAQTRVAAATSMDMESFLRDLMPRVMIEPVDGTTLDRIVQLIAKTNQFKLNPATFTSEEIRARAADVIPLRLVDRLQDYGIVAVAVTEPHGDRLEVLTWVMSCRVFSRRLEHTMREVLAAQAAAIGALTINAHYIPSKRNALLPDALAAIGFRDRDDGHFETSLQDAQPVCHYMVIEDRRRTTSTARPGGSVSAT